MKKDKDKEKDKEKDKKKEEAKKKEDEKKKGKESKKSKKRDRKFFVYVSDALFDQDPEPYVKPIVQVTYEDMSYTSQSSTGRTAKAPKWSDNFIFNITTLDLNCSIKVYDGSVSKDCLLMTVKHPISHLWDEKQRHEALESNGGDLDGKIFVTWRIEEFQNFDYVVDPAPIVGILDLTVVGAVNLKSKTGGRNPQAIISYANQKLPSQVVQNSLNPEWNFVNELQIREFESVCAIRVIDNDTFQRDHLGTVTIDWPMMLKSKDQQVDKKILLEPDDIDMTNQSMHVNGELLVRYKFRYGTSVPVQPVVIQANFRDVPPEFPAAPPEDWKVIPPNLSPDEYKLNVRQKMHREEWENSLGLYQRKIASGDHVGAQAVIRAAQLQQEKATDLYNPIVKPVIRSTNSSGGLGPGGGGGSTFVNPLLQQEVMNPLLEKKNSQADFGSPDAMASPRVGRGARGAPKEERDNRVRQSSYGLDQASRIKLAAMGGSNPLFGGGGGDDGSESEGGPSFGTSTMMVNPLIPRARESDPSAGPKKRGVVGNNASGEASSRVRVDRENPMNSSNSTIVNPLNKSEESAEDQSAKPGRGADVKGSGGVARGGQIARPSGGRIRTDENARGEGGAYSPEQVRSMEESMKSEEDPYSAPMVIGKDSSPEHGMKITQPKKRGLVHPELVIVPEHDHDANQSEEKPLSSRQRSGSAGTANAANPRQRSGSQGSATTNARDSPANANLRNRSGSGGDPSAKSLHPANFTSSGGGRGNAGGNGSANGGARQRSSSGGADKSAGGLPSRQRSSSGGQESRPLDRNEKPERGDRSERDRLREERREERAAVAERGDSRADLRGGPNSSPSHSSSQPVNVMSPSSTPRMRSSSGGDPQQQQPTQARGPDSRTSVSERLDRAGSRDQPSSPPQQPSPISMGQLLTSTPPMQPSPTPRRGESSRALNDNRKPHGKYQDGDVDYSEEDRDHAPVPRTSQNKTIPTTAKAGKTSSRGDLRAGPNSKPQSRHSYAEAQADISEEGERDERANDGNYGGGRHGGGGRGNRGEHRGNESHEGRERETRGGDRDGGRDGGREPRGQNSRASVMTPRNEGHSSPHHNPRASMLIQQGPVSPNPRASIMMERAPVLPTHNKPKEVVFTAETTVGRFSLETALPDNVPHHMLFKIVVIGNSGVGKTNLLFRWLDNTFERTSSTIAIEFSTKSFNIDNNVVKVQLWDTAGQEKFRAITQSYYRNSHGAILVYDITDMTSFNALNVWLQTLKEAQGNENIKVMLVGNKRDLEEDRQVPTSTGLAWSREQGLYFLETSAADGSNVHRAFQILLDDIYTNMLTSIAKNAELAKVQQLTGKVAIVGNNQKPADSCCMDSLFSES